MSYKPYLNTACQLAREASKHILQNIDRLDRIKVQQKAADDYVTSVDKSIEQLIIMKIQELYPEHDILTEESGKHGSNGEYLWVIDPIDGTSNFISNIPIFAISIALLHNNEPVIGVIYQPMTDELFSACQGQGAKLNNTRIRSSDSNHITHLLLSLPKGSRVPDDLPSKVLKPLKTEYPRIRALGSAALSLAYQAAGRSQMFYGRNLKLWDIAAGLIIAKEAGSVVQYQSETNYAITEIVSGEQQAMTLSL